jgi:hypothetical protein
VPRFNDVVPSSICDSKHGFFNIQSYLDIDILPNMENARPQLGLLTFFPASRGVSSG